MYFFSFPLYPHTTYCVCFPLYPYFSTIINRYLWLAFFVPEIFTVETETIHPECLKAPWVTPLARRTIMLAFNLYENWMPEEYPEDCSPGALFDEGKIRKFLIRGVELRYKET